MTKTLPPVDFEKILDQKLHKQTKVLSEQIDELARMTKDGFDNVLEKIETTGHKIAVLGDMMELGKYSIEEHRKAGEHARKVASLVVTVGQRSKKMAEKTDSGIVSFDTSLQAAEYVRSKVEKGDVILVKGSQSTRMERVSKVLLAEPEKASELLVRQDPEWLAKK